MSPAYARGGTSRERGSTRARRDDRPSPHGAPRVRVRLSARATPCRRRAWSSTSPLRGQHRPLAARRRAARQAPPPAHQDAQVARDRRAPDCAPEPRGIAVAKVGRGGGVRGEASTTSSSPIPCTAPRSGSGSPSLHERADHGQRRQPEAVPGLSAAAASAGVVRPRPDRHRLGLPPLRRPGGRPRRDRGARAAGASSSRVSSSTASPPIAASSSTAPTRCPRRGRPRRGPPGRGRRRPAARARHRGARGHRRRHDHGATASREVAGVTEVRAGTYVFNDLMQVGFGSARDDCALSIHCTVVSTRLAGQATIDAGSKTFSGDRGVVGGSGGTPPAIAPRSRQRRRARANHRGARHRAGGRRRRPRWASGSPSPDPRLHAVNLSDELFGVRDGIVEEVWPVRARGKRT